LLAALPALATPQISVTGYGWAEYLPDRMAVTATFEALAPAPAQALARLANSSNPFLEGLKELGLNASLTGFSLEAVHSYESGSKVFKGYRARMSLRVVLTDLELAGEVASLAARCGAKEVNAYAYPSKGLVERAYLEALEMAARDAKLRAEAVAKGLGLALGEPVRIEIGKAYWWPPVRALGEAGKAYKAAVTIPAPAKERAEAWVTVTFTTLKK